MSILDYTAPALSRCAGAIANCPIPTPLRPLVLGTFAKQFGINVSESEHPISHYGSLNDFFTRNLKADCRPIDPTPSHLVSPVDGLLLECGQIHHDTLIQAKGLTYTLGDLIPTEDAALFKDGQFATIYLAPHDCHRIFSPLDGEIHHMTHVPGKLLPVREPYISTYSNLYTVNERVISILHTPKGHLAVIMVGATNVGHISSPLDPTLRTNVSNATLTTTTYPSPLSVKKGQWTHTFHLGSTVILVATPSLGLRWEKSLKESLIIGEKLASF